jgi:hypothetical protein
LRRCPLLSPTMEACCFLFRYTRTHLSARRPCTHCCVWLCVSAGGVCVCCISNGTRAHQLTVACLSIAKATRTPTERSMLMTPLICTCSLSLLVCVLLVKCTRTPHCVCGVGFFPERRLSPPLVTSALATGACTRCPYVSF